MLCANVSVCVCVCERERERGGGGGVGRERACVRACLRVCVCVRERERESLDWAVQTHMNGRLHEHSFVIETYRER